MGPKNGPMLYEEVRKQRLEENKKRMEELGLSDLSKSLSKSLSPVAKLPLSRQIKSRTPKETLLVEVRRSSRVANSPQPDYREVEIQLPSARRSYVPSSRLPKRYASDTERWQAANRADKLEKELKSNNPSFVKLMLQSHVSGCFWLGLPSLFCKTHLPRKDETIVLEDENGGEWETVYLAVRTGLSGGWRGFAVDHALEDGDAIVFELVQHWRFKVHIVRASEVEMDDKEERVAVPAKDLQKENTKENADERLSKKGSKRKQGLLKENIESEDRLEAGKADAGLQKGRKKQQHVIQKGEDKVSPVDKDKTELQITVSNTASSTIKIEDQHVQYEEQANSKDSAMKSKKFKQLTSFLQSRKPNSLSEAVALVKPMTVPSDKCIDVINVPA